MLGTDLPALLSLHNTVRERDYISIHILFSHSVVSDSLQPHGLKHTRLPSPSPSPGACSNPCSLSMSGDAIQPSHPLLLPSPPASNLSSIWVFSNESVIHIRWPNYWSFSFSISPSNEYSEFISFRIDRFDLLA